MEWRRERKRLYEEREEWVRDSKRRRGMEDKMGKLVEVVGQGEKGESKEEEREQRKLEDIRERVRVEINERERLWRERGQ